MSKELFRKSTLGSQHTVSNGAPNYERYEYLESVFYRNDLYKIFAKPIILGRDTYGRPAEIRWMTDYDYIGEPVSLTDHSPGEQENIKGKVKTIIDTLYSDAIRYMASDPVYKDLAGILDSCIEIPNDGCIYVLRVPDERGNPADRYVLTQWGFVNDDRRSSTGLIKRWTGSKTQDIRIRAVYPDGSAAAGETIHAEYGAVARELTTDETGIVKLEDVMVNSSLHLYQLSGGVKNRVHNFNTDGRAEYAMTIDRPEKKVVVPPEPPVLPPDPPVLPPDPPVRPPDPPVIKPVSSPVTLQFVDNKGKPVPGLPVTLGYDSRKYALKTDGEGKTVITDLVPGKVMNLHVNSGNWTYRGNIPHSAGVANHVVTLKKRMQWWIWLLLALLVLLLLYLFWPHTTMYGSYKVTVLDSARHPVSQASVALKGVSNPAQLTDALGEAKFSRLSVRDTFLVLVSARDYSDVTYTGVGNKDTTVILTRIAQGGGGTGGGAGGADTVVHNPPVTGSLLVHVIDADTRYDLKNANVQLVYNDLLKLTNGFGKAVFDSIGTGIRTSATVSLDDYVPATQEVVCCTENIVALKPRVMYCGTDSVTEKNKGITSTFTWDIGQGTSEFTLVYDMQNIPDQLDIFCGKDTTGNKIFTTGEPVSGQAVKQISNTCNMRYITVRVTGNDGRDSLGNYKTAWFYQLIRCK